MTLTELTATRTGERMAWFVVLALYGACWFLPILRDAVGFNGAHFAHASFWELVSGKTAIDSGNDILRALFITVGWPANELFVIGVAMVVKRSRLSVRLLAFAFGIMISWQVAFVDAFPLAIGYWSWVAAGGLALWLAAARLARKPRGAARVFFADRPALALLLAPNLIAAITVAVEGF